MNIQTATSANLSSWCQKLTPRLPSISAAACRDSQLTPTGTSSVKNFPILMRRIPATDATNKKPPIRVLLIGGIHGDELTASAIVFRWLRLMSNPMAKSFSWEVVPVLNPDGLLRNTPQRVNAHGVDLNRNFPMPNWHKEALGYWERVTNKDPRRYPGPYPLSEPETKWLNDEINRFQPHVIISVHAPFGVLDFDGPVHPPQRFGRLFFAPVGVYPGSLGNYSGVQRNMPIITIELANALAMPNDVEVQKIWEDMLLWIQRNVPPEKKTSFLSLPFKKFSTTLSSFKHKED